MPISPLNHELAQPTPPGAAAEPEKKSICKLCGKTFNKPQQLAAHKRKEHPGAPGQGHTPSAATHPFRCKECGARFQAATALGKHRSAIHGIKGKSQQAVRRRSLKATTTFKCPECRQRFAEARLLGLHRKREHHVAGTSKSAVRARAYRVIAPSRNYTCPECGREFKNGSGLGVHLATIHKIKGSQQREITQRSNSQNGNASSSHTQEDAAAIGFWINQSCNDIRQIFAINAARVDLATEEFSARCLAILQGSSKTLRRLYRLPDSL